MGVRNGALKIFMGADSIFLFYNRKVLEYTLILCNTFTNILLGYTC